MELALGVSGSCKDFARSVVSILVFVELALGVLRRYPSLRRSSSFNPCFCGTRPRRREGIQTRNLGIRVSILVFVELALGVSEFARNNRPQLVSILVFVELALGADATLAPVPDAMVSILVFVELALGDDRAVTISNLPNSFNPCFCGTRPRSPCDEHPDDPRVYGFNPCFCGTRPRRQAHLPDIDLPCEFQSLFLWNSPSEIALSSP